MRKKPLLIGKDEFGRAETGLYLFVGNRSAFGLIISSHIHLPIRYNVMALN